MSASTPIYPFLDLVDMKVLRVGIRNERILGIIRDSKLAASVDDSWFSKCVAGSRETATHFKWFIGSNDESGFRLWLHEFKSDEERRAGYANTIHNHRYALDVTILRGGYEHASFEVDFDTRTMALQSARAVQSNWIAVGESYSIEPPDFHKLDRMEEGTLSLVLERPARSEVSYSVDAERNRVIRHMPLEERVFNGVAEFEEPPGERASF